MPPVGNSADEAKRAVRGTTEKTAMVSCAAVGSVKPFAIGMHVDFGVIIAADEIVGQRGENLELERECLVAALLVKR